MEKEEKYRLLTAQVKSLIEGETDFVSVMANVCSVIHEAMGFFWTGFYVVDEESHELHVGPFHVVPDVEAFPGHIACSSLSRSEIVVPLFNQEGQVKAVLDIDSKELNTFDAVDQRWLEELVKML